MAEGTLLELAAIVEGELHGDDQAYSGVSTDTRSIQPDQLFVALSGPNFDGNRFVAQAAAAGASGALVERIEEHCSVSQVWVADTLVALGRLGHEWRSRFDLPVVGVTGSNGKTTVKEMIAAILGVAGRTHATKGNLNNEIGVPLTLMQIDARHDFAVIEMGANHAGEIARLTAMTAPSVGVVTNAGPAHLEGFGSLDGVASAKGELFEGLKPDAVAVINNDDVYFRRWQSTTRARNILTFGLSPDADFAVTSVDQCTNGHGDGLKLALRTPDGSLNLKLPLPGTHNAANAAAAAAAAWAAGVGLPEISAGLQRVTTVPGRLAVLRSRSGARVIDDAYNANPASVQAAIDLLAAQPGNTWLVLGDMGELGPDATDLHARVGERARAAGIDRLFTVGPFSAAAAERFGESALAFDSTADLIDALRNELRDGVTVLVKASRSMGLEKVSAALIDEDGS